MDIDLVVDVANVMGARPDGWWRNRAAAAGRLVQALSALPRSQILGPDSATLNIGRLLAVVEGQARAIPDVPGVEVVRAVADGDSAVVSTCVDLLRVGRRPLVVTADRGLRQRLPPGATAVGPRWLLALLF